MNFADENTLIQNGQTAEIKRTRNHVLQILKKGIEAVDPYHAVSGHFDGRTITIDSEIKDLSDFGHIYLASFGKASIGMANAVIDHCQITQGVVITPDKSQQINHENITVFYGDHPLPNQGSIDGTKAIETMLQKVTDDDLLIILISGGGSALLCHPRVSLEDMQITTTHLLRSGADITEINTVRKHLSFVKGGQLIQQVKGCIISLIISDVIGDPLGFIASGPTVGDETSFQDVTSIFDSYNLWNKIPRSVQDIVNKGLNHEIEDTPHPSDFIGKTVKNVIIANNTLACETMHSAAESLGYHPIIYSTTVKGEAREVGNSLVDVLDKRYEMNGTTMLIAGGETTVTVQGKGKGGRNQEMVLGCLSHLQDRNMVFASCGSDGVDGMSHAAGAIADSYSKQRAENLNLSITSYLNENNSTIFFQRLNDLLITGPTGTNVMDLCILVKINQN